MASERMSRKRNAEIDPQEQPHPLAAQAERLDSTTLLALDQAVDERALRKSLGQMVLRVIERLETEMLSGNTLRSSSAALAGRLVESAQYLEGLVERMNRASMASGPQDVEAKLLLLNSLLADLKKMRLGKGMRTRDPAGGIVGNGKPTEARPSTPVTQPEEPIVQQEDTEEVVEGVEGIDGEMGDGTLE